MTFESDLLPENREFPAFSLTRLLGTVFDPTEGCRICVLIDLERPETEMEGFRFLRNSAYAVQRKAYEVFYLGLKNGGMEDLGMGGGDLFAYEVTNGSNLDLKDECWDTSGRQLSLDRDVYPNHDIILCISAWSATAPLTRGVANEVPLQRANSPLPCVDRSWAPGALTSISGP